MKHFLYVSLLTLLFVGCEDKESPKPEPRPKPEPPKQEEVIPELKSFTIKQANNKEIIPFDIKAVIKEHKILLSLNKNFKTTKLIPSFTTTEETKVTLDGKEQISGKTTVDFSKALRYTLTSKTKNKEHYDVETKFVELAFSEFALKKEHNPSLKEDIVAKKDDKGQWLLTVKSNEAIYTPSFSTEAKEVLINGKKQESGVSKVDFTKAVSYTLVSKEGFRYTEVIKLKREPLPKLSVAKLEISTEDSKPIISKDDYLKATFKFISAEGEKTYKGKIRGRGNSTWGRPKKPYKIKFKKETALFGMKAEEDWVLLANHLDPTLMLTATAMKIGEQIKVAYVNHIVPIDVTLNGKYVGQYNLTEQIEVKKNRVNVKGGVLLELDTYFDGKNKFKSSYYRLPINIKYPKKKVTPETVAKIKSEFEKFESLVASVSFPNNNYSDYFDKEAYVKYLLVQYLTANLEINHPKSTYMHKAPNGKFTMGPIWDFDWAYGYHGNGHFTSYQEPLFSWNGYRIGTQFFSRIASDPEIAQRIKAMWQDYRANKFDQLLSYLDEYYQAEKDSRAKDYEVWHTGNGDFDKEYQELRTWLINRANFLDRELSKL